MVHQNHELCQPQENACLKFTIYCLVGHQSSPCAGSVIACTVSNLNRARARHGLVWFGRLPSKSRTWKRTRIFQMFSCDCLVLFLVAVLLVGTGGPNVTASVGVDASSSWFR